MARPSRIYLPLDALWLDDDKVIAAGERAAFLYVAILCRIKILDTDGVISRAQISRIGIQGWQTRLARLVAVGLLLTDDGDEHIVPRWTKWNELSHERAERHRKDRERKRFRAESERNPDGIRMDSVLKQVSKVSKQGNPPQPPPVSDVLRRIRNPPGSSA